MKTSNHTDATLNDPLVVAFEDASLAPASFHHREHLYVAWCYLSTLSLEEALSRYVHHLKKLTVALRVPHKFHATITWTYMLLLNEAMHQSPGTSFEELITQHAHLLRHPSAALGAYYDSAQLNSEAARSRFVLPRRG